MKENTDGWKTHNGGECPIPDAKAWEFEIKLMNGGTLIGREDAILYLWGHLLENGFDIIAYRLIEVQK